MHPFDEIADDTAHAVLARLLPTPDCRIQRCSGILQRGRSLAAIETRIRAALARDIEDGAVVLSWPDPRMVGR